VLHHKEQQQTTRFNRVTIPFKGPLTRLNRKKIKKFLSLIKFKQNFFFPIAELPSVFCTATFLFFPSFFFCLNFFIIDYNRIIKEFLLFFFK